MLNDKKLDFGIDPIKTIIEKNSSSSAEEIIAIIMDRMEEFIADTPRVDDVSVIILKRA
jgi:serine phosphatase RsbU (regulator of sigma subunit)